MDQKVFSARTGPTRVHITLSRAIGQATPPKRNRLVVIGLFLGGLAWVVAKLNNAIQETIETFEAIRRAFLSKLAEYVGEQLPRYRKGSL